MHGQTRFKHILYSTTFYENRAVYEIMSKNMVEPQGPQITSQYGTDALRAGLARLYARMRTHTPTIPGTSTQAGARTHKYVTLTAFLRVVT